MRYNHHSRFGRVFYWKVDSNSFQWSQQINHAIKVILIKKFYNITLLLLHRLSTQNNVLLLIDAISEMSHRFIMVSRNWRIHSLLCKRLIWIECFRRCVRHNLAVAARGFLNALYSLWDFLRDLQSALCTINVRHE